MQLLSVSGSAGPDRDRSPTGRICTSILPLRVGPDRGMVAAFADLPSQNLPSQNSPALIPNIPGSTIPAM